MGYVSSDVDCQSSREDTQRFYADHQNWKACCIILRDNKIFSTIVGAGYSQRAQCHSDSLVGVLNSTSTQLNSLQLVQIRFGSAYIDGETILQYWPNQIKVGGSKNVCISSPVTTGNELEEIKPNSALDHLTFNVSITCDFLTRYIT
ncbi:hypothetical protein TNCV_2438101 [Trichonephila clavipes]|nr:hypothetical protein TNCV_2438101 [Trichonephila clavipes]